PGSRRSAGRCGVGIRLRPGRQARGDYDHDDPRGDDAARDDQPAPAPARPGRAAWSAGKCRAHRASRDAGLVAAGRVADGLVTAGLVTGGLVAPRRARLPAGGGRLAEARLLRLALPAAPGWLVLAEPARLRLPKGAAWLAGLPRLPRLPRRGRCCPGAEAALSRDLPEILSGLLARGIAGDRSD